MNPKIESFLKNLKGAKKIFAKLPKIPWVLAGHVFWVVLISILLNMILGEILFYKYVILVEKKEPIIVKAPLEFEKKSYQKVLEEWKKREEKFNESQSQEPLTPFE